MESNEKFVVVACKKMNGSKVFSAAMTREKAEESMVNILNAKHLLHYGPFRIIPYEEAEKKKMYGD